MHTLLYTKPAATWTEALPLGNGHQGAMVFGTANSERIMINEGTAWSGSVRSESTAPVVSPDLARGAVTAARDALARGDTAAADAEVRRLQHRWSQTFLPFAELEVRIDHPAADPATAVRGYERALDLDSATHTVRYESGGTGVVQTSFASHPHRVLVHQVRTTHPVDVVLTLSTPLRVLSWFGPGAAERGGDTPLEAGLLLQLPSDVAPPHEDVPDPVRWDDRPGAALRGAAMIGVGHDGLAGPGTRPASVVLRSVTRVDTVIGTATTFEGIGLPFDGDEHRASVRARERVRDAFAVGVPEVRRRQLADHRALYRRTVWSASTVAGPRKPTDERLAAANASPNALASDPELAPLLFHYGRYLLVSCSREGGTPATLQGIWNQDMRPPWSSNYTTNINLQMNYWAADTADLPETLPPLIDLVTALARSGQETARRLYGARGWVAHHNTDVWAYTQPVGLGRADPKWAFWPFAGAWLVAQLNDHLAFGARSLQDPARFRREVLWPLTRSAARFVLDWLVDEGTTLGTAPSTSPENTYLTADGAAASVGRSSAMDLALARDLLTRLLALASDLGADQDSAVVQARQALRRLPGPCLGRDGALREWADDPLAEDPHHRHQSHLFALFPGTAELSDEHLRGAVRSLDLRGDESTGWSLAWRLALRARLRQPEAVDRLLALLFRDMATDRGAWSGGLYPNLFAAHPPFQIDANLGYVAAVAECLVQSHHDRITLLPALPGSFAPGGMVGLIARPGVRVDIDWGRMPGQSGSGLLRARLTALHRAAHGPRAVGYRNRVLTVELSDSPVELTGASFDA